MQPTLSKYGTLMFRFPESSLNDEAGKLFMDSYDEYAKRARLMTSVHAMKSAKPPAMGLKNGDAADESADVCAAKRTVTKEQKKQKENKKKGLKRL